ncbi:hypothetical protein KQX54_010200 [Cotesia glomerata]|uniref:ZSWIM3 N-terminal domain-containing protein n=1 Tax=Cotesia glomerata TaxID=32391 RepID=A0AAV7IEN8_COTGL|nr:hypothetical protein KQX54_010200 [Cotesia glomerata]
MEDTREQPEQADSDYFPPGANAPLNFRAFQQEGYHQVDWLYVFRLNNLFNDHKEIETKLKLYKATTGYEFNTLNSTTLERKNFKQNYNKKLIYDDRYLKCIVNPKPKAARDFEVENPGIKVKQCPAHLTFRTTTDKQQLTITQFEPEHDHDPSDTTSRLKACKQQVAKNKIQDTVIINHEQNLDDSVNSSVLNFPDDQQIQSPIVTESNIEVLSSLPEVADESFNIADIAVVCEEDFDILLKNMEINIRSTLHKEEQNQKIYRINQMLNDINNNQKNFGVTS